MRQQTGRFRAIDLPELEFATGLTPLPEGGFFVYPQTSPAVRRTNKRSSEGIVETEGSPPKKSVRFTPRPEKEDCDDENLKSKFPPC